MGSGPGHPESGANVIPRQIAMEADANQQVTDGEFPTRKKLCRLLNRKMQLKALCANEAAIGAKGP